MKSLLLTFSALVVAVSLIGQTPETNVETPTSAGVVTFTKLAHGFGDVQQGIPAAYEFEFTNTGTEPVVINNVKSSCGCTVPEWTRSPVLPGETGIVKAQYNAAKPGPFTKYVTVYSNATNGELRLTISGKVLAKSEQKGVPENEGNMLLGR